MLRLAIQHSDEITNIRCKGRIVFGDHLELLRAAILSQTTPQVTLDLSGVHLIDAGGLGLLVDLHQQFQNAGRKMELTGPTPFVHYTMRITCLETVFHIVRNRARERQEQFRNLLLVRE